ncbi:MAG: hypothetical protein VX777_09600 [Chlamydiota bacterium]|nr:hypothetical protein [Chlamydiota bacterium]
MNINSSNYADLPLGMRLEILDKDEDFQHDLSVKNRADGTSLYIKTIRETITSPDTNEDHIQKIQKLYYTKIEKNLKKDFLCGACTENHSYLVIKQGDNVVVESYNKDLEKLSTDILKPENTLCTSVLGFFIRSSQYSKEAKLAEFVAGYESDRYVNSAWTPKHYTNDDKIRFTERTPGFEFKKKQIEGCFPNNEISSTLNIGNEYIPTIAKSAFTYRRAKSARSVI